MPYTSSPFSGTYWIDDPIPSAPNLGVQSNFYVKPDNTVIKHPGWQYPNGALVSDEYLFNNKSYKLVVNSVPPVVGVGTTLFIDRKPASEWVGIGTTALQVDWYEYTIAFGNTFPNFDFDQEVTVGTSFTTTPSEVATFTYNVVGLGSTAYLEKIQQYRNFLGDVRNNLLAIGITSASGIDTSAVPSGTFTQQRFETLNFVGVGLRTTSGITTALNDIIIGLCTNLPPFDTLF